jgi:hypothetical protein
MRIRVHMWRLLEKCNFVTEYYILSFFSCMTIGEIWHLERKKKGWFPRVWNNNYKENYIQQ